jgi:hypothetical protein
MINLRTPFQRFAIIFLILCGITSPAQQTCSACTHFDSSGKCLTSIPISVPPSQRELDIRNLLAAHNITVNKFPPCTQVGGVLKSTILQLFQFQAQWGGPLQITGGNEQTDPATGKSVHVGEGLRNHWNGWKVDLQIGTRATDPLADPLSRFIGGFISAGDRNDVAGTAPQWRTPCSAANPLPPPQWQGTVFALEYPTPGLNDHWDSQFDISDFFPLDPVTVKVAETKNVSVIARDFCFADIGLLPEDFNYDVVDPSIASVDTSGNLIGATTGDTDLRIAQGVLEVVPIHVVPPDPPPSSPGGTWIWDQSANGGTGAYKWIPNTPPPTCVGGCNPPPSSGGIPPTPGACLNTLAPVGPCWVWSPTANGGNGAWLFVAPPNKKTKRSRLTSAPVLSQDPNDIVGPPGQGPSRYIGTGQPFTYAIYFENLETATAPAQVIFVSDPLPSDLDPATVRLGSITIGGNVVTPPDAFLVAVPYSTTVDLRPSRNVMVQIDASLDSVTGRALWKFSSLDPDSGLPVTDPLAGILPPGIGGSVTLNSTVKPSVQTGASVQNQATVIFDNNPSINTPTWINTIDISAPSSTVLPLLAIQTSIDFTVSWQGSDVGSGIGDFSIYVSDNGGPFTVWLSNTTLKTGQFHGFSGHSYSFYSIARDIVGNEEGQKTIADANTQVIFDTTPPIILPNVNGTAGNNGWYTTNVSIGWNVSDAESGITVSNGCVPSVLSNETGGVTVACNATNGVDLTSSASIPIRIDKTPPSINGSRMPLANVNGWNNTNVAVSFACSDVLSGLAPGSPPGTALVSSEGLNQQVPGVCLDLAGNSASATVSGINIDKTPPSIAPSRTPTANANGWNNTNVTVSFACADALSGLALGSPPAATVLSSEGTNQQASGTCLDLAGNSASATASGINIDKTPPALSGLPAVGCTLWPPDKKFVTVGTISAADVLSGLASFTVTGTSNEPHAPSVPDIIITGTGLGPRTVQLRADRLGTGTGRVYTLTSTATDAAGNVVNVISTCVVPHDQAL